MANLAWYQQLGLIAFVAVISGAVYNTSRKLDEVADHLREIRTLLRRIAER